MCMLQLERLLNESNAIKDCAITILFKSETDLQECYVVPLVNKGNLSSARLLITRNFRRAPPPPLTTSTATLLLHLPRCSFWAENFLYIILFMAIPVEARVAERLTTRTGDLEVRGSRPAPRRAVSLDNELYSTFFLFTQVYKWVPARSLRSWIPVCCVNLK